MEKGRTEAFSDGVFAIAITLLILEIRVPEEHSDMTNQELIAALGHLWPSFLAFFVSFATILVMWINHHALFTLVRHTSRSFLLANGFLLLGVTFVPFPTAVLARHLNDEAARAAAVVYCGTYVLISIAYSALLWTAMRNGLISEQVPPARIRRVRRTYLIGLVVYCVATMIAWNSPLAGVAICSTLWVLWVRLRYTSA